MGPVGSVVALIVTNIEVHLLSGKVLRDSHVTFSGCDVQWSVAKCILNVWVSTVISEQHYNVI